MRRCVLLAALAMGFLFDASAQPPWRVDPPEWGFGRIPADKPVYQDVVVENRRAEPLRVAFILTCDCLYAEPREADIHSGGKATFRLHFDPAAYEGPVEKNLIVRFQGWSADKGLFRVFGEGQRREGSTALIEAGEDSAGGDGEALRRARSNQRSATPCAASPPWKRRKPRVSLPRYPEAESGTPSAWLRVFSSYFLIGLGFFQAIRLASTFTRVATAINRQASSGASTTRSGSGRVRAAIVGGMPVLGFLVSVFELACTGQVYLPTIVYLVRTERQLGGYLYLGLYNLGFIAPLLGVFGLSVAGQPQQPPELEPAPPPQQGFLWERGLSAGVCDALSFPASPACGSCSAGFPADSSATSSIFSSLQQPLFGANSFDQNPCFVCSAISHSPSLNRVEDESGQHGRQEHHRHEDGHQPDLEDRGQHAHLRDAHARPADDQRQHRSHAHPLLR